MLILRDYTANITYLIQYVLCVAEQSVKWDDHEHSFPSSRFGRSTDIFNIALNMSFRSTEKLLDIVLWDWFILGLLLRKI
jgi:hypothetical protein